MTTATTLITYQCTCCPNRKEVKPSTSMESIWCEFCVIPMRVVTK